MEFVVHVARRVLEAVDQRGHGIGHPPNGHLAAHDEIGQGAQPFRQALEQLLPGLVGDALVAGVSSRDQFLSSGGWFQGGGTAGRIGRGTSTVQFLAQRVRLSKFRQSLLCGNL